MTPAWKPTGKKENRNEFSNQIHQKFNAKYGNRAYGNDLWLCYTNWDDYINWNSDTYLKVYEGQMKSIIQSKVQELLKFTDSDS